MAKMLFKNYKLLYLALHDHKSGPDLCHAQQVSNSLPHTVVASKMPTTILLCAYQLLVLTYRLIMEQAITMTL